MSSSADPYRAQVRRVAARPVYGPGAHLDLGDFAVLPMIAGFFIVYLNLEEFVAPGLNNLIEKPLLVLAAVMFLATRPIAAPRLFLALAFAAAPAVSLIGTDYLHTEFGRFVRGFLSYMAPWLLMTASLKERDALTFLAAFSFSPVLCVGLGFVVDALGMWSMFHHSYEGAIRLQGSTIPAFLAAGSALACFTALCCARHMDQRYFLLAVVNLAILALTGGRMALAIGLLACGFFVMFRYRITWGLLIKGLLAVSILVAVAFVAFPDLIHRLANSTDSGRGMLWSALIHVWDNHPYFGIGLGHQGTVVPAHVVKRVTTNAAHNEFIRLGVEIGWVGLSLLISVILVFILTNWLSAPKRGDPVFPVMCLLFLLFCYSDNALSLPTIFGLMTAAYCEMFVGVDRPRRIPLKLFRRKPPLAG